MGRKNGGGREEAYFVLHFARFGGGNKERALLNWFLHSISHMGRKMGRLYAERERERLICCSAKV